jgi:hypothetical protein
MRSALFVLAACGLAGSASAQVNFFTDRAVWENTVGTPRFNLSLNGIGADQEFRTTTRSLGAGVTVRQTGNNTTNFRNLIDAPPLAFGDNNGTTNLSCFTNFPEGANPGVQVVLDFTDPVRAFAFETWEATGGEGVIMEVRRGGTLLGSTIIGGGNGDFTGFTLDNTFATSVVLRSRFLTAGQGGEGFGLDNLSGAFSARFISSRATWESEVGPLRVLETFAGFAADLEYRTVTRSLAGGLMSIRQTGDPANNFRNLIDVPPFLFTDNNGTDHASAFVNFPEGANPGLQNLISFDPPAHAFALETWIETGGEGVVLEVLNGATVIGDVTLSTADGAFRGVDLGDAVATGVRLRSATLDAGAAGEGFGADNFQVLPRVRTYGTLTSWTSAAGGPVVTEAFTGFSSDLQFRTVTRSLAGGMRIRQTGTDENFRNEIDVPPLVFSDNNGTAHASSFVNFPEGASPGTQVVVDFTRPVRAVSFQTWGANSSEGVIVELRNGSTILETATLTDTDGAFVGFVLPRLAATSMRFRSASLTVGSGGEGFGLDNIRVVLVPPACPPDLNEDGELTFDDIQLFVALYNANDARADFNNDEEWTFDDIQLFIQLFNAGC